MFARQPSPPPDANGGIARPVPATAAPPQRAPERPWALALAPPFPPVALAILSMTTSEHVSSRELGAMIRRDASFTAELLRVANSALFGFSRHVGSVAHAVVLLGLDRVKAMAMYVALRASLPGALRSDTLKRVWVHTVATALLSERLALKVRLAGEEPYTAGLLHNLGAMGLMCAYPTDYAQLLESHPDGGRELLDSERSIFGVDHCEAGGYLANNWRLPEDIAEVARTHHQEPEWGNRTVSNIVRVAVRMADAIGFGGSPEAKPDPACEELLSCIGISSFDPVEDLVEMIGNQLAFVPAGQ